MSQVPVYFLLALPLVGAFAMFALGIVVIHQASRVLNLAHGAMAMVPAFVAYSLVKAGVPMPVAMTLGVVSGALIGVVVERVFVRGLRPQGATAQTVGTVAALGLLMGIAIKVWGTTPRTAVRLFPEGGIDVGASVLRWGQIGLLGVAIVCTAALFALFRYTETGLAMRAAADNRRAAALMGIDPDTTARLAWALGGALAAIAGILLAAVTVLHPVNLTLLVLPAFVAALLGGLGNLTGAASGACIVGIVFGMVPAIALVPGIGSFATQVGAPQLVLTVLALGVMALRGERFTGAAASADVVPAVAHAPGDGGEPVAHRIRVALIGVGIVTLLVWPLFAPFSIVGDAVQACIILIVAASLVLLTGWVGQISLAHATLVGIGAFVTAALANRAGLQFPLSLVPAAGASAAIAVGIGLVALRVRGLYLAVATLIVLWMSNEYLFRASWLVGAGGSASFDVKPVGRAGAFPYFDFTERRTFYYVVLAAAAATLWALVNIRDSKTGRSFFAVRGSETAAASLGIDVTRTKLLAFAISGLLAGVAGNLLITGQGAASPAQFDFNTSMFYLAVAVVGGIVSLGGAVAASVVFAALSEVFFRVRFLTGWLDIVSAVLLTGVLLAYPGGLAAVAAPLRPFFRRRLGFGSGAPTSTVVAASANGRHTSIPKLARRGRADAPALLEASNVVVQFGGLKAVDDVSLEVREGEIVGLIGPNGAGKTTLFNAVSGLVVPTAGSVHLFGRDVSRTPVHERAALGLGRTFQVVQLFGQLSIFENVLVATHLQNPTGVLSHLAVTTKAFTSERAARERVRESLALLGLEHVAGRPVAGQPLGILRLVEVARALVTGARVVMLDEAASGLDSTETEQLVEHLFYVRDRLGVSILLIEHDVRMVTSTCDYIYVIDRGTMLAHGVPEAIRRDRAVVEAYLGAEPALV